VTPLIAQIDKNIEDSDLILLLISADFIASDYCYDCEMNLAIQRHNQGSARVIPVIIREVKWDLAPFGKLQALPLNGKPVATWGPDQYARDIAGRNVSYGIAKVLRDLYDRN
jgi:internalin A